MSKEIPTHTQKLPYGFVMTCNGCLCEVWFHKDQRPTVNTYGIDTWEVVCSMCGAVYRFQAKLDMPK